MRPALSSASRPRTAAEVAGRHAILLVSPHYDDAALSAGAFADLGRPVDIVTVFTRASGRGVVSRWDRRSGFASEGAALAARDLEDRGAFAPDGHRLLRVGLVEIGYAGPPPRPAGEAGLLRAWFDDWHAACGDPVPLVLLPIGAGRPAVPPGSSAPRRAAAVALRGAASLVRGLGLIRGTSGPAQHPDHLWVRDVLAAHVAARGATLGFYEEQPYLRGRRGDAAAAELGRTLGLALDAVELPVDVAAKSRRIAAYASQIEQLRRGDPDITRPAAAERYWFVRRSPESPAGREAAPRQEAAPAPDRGALAATGPVPPAAAGAGQAPEALSPSPDALALGGTAAGQSRRASDEDGPRDRPAFAADRPDRARPRTAGPAACHDT